MDLYTAFATFGFACMIYAISKLLELISKGWLAKCEHLTISRILLILSMLLCLFSIPAVAVFGLLDRVTSDLRASEREKDRRKMHILMDMAKKPHAQQIKDAQQYFDYHVAVPSDFNFDEFASEVFRDIFS